MDSALRIGRQELPLTFPIGLVLNDKLFGLRILASHWLELQREYLTEENNHFMFDILNRGIWDQDVMDTPTDAVRATLPSALKVMNASSVGKLVQLVTASRLILYHEGQINPMKDECHYQVKH